MTAGRCPFSAQTPREGPHGAKRKASHHVNLFPALKPLPATSHHPYHAAREPLGGSTPLARTSRETLANGRACSGLWVCGGGQSVPIGAVAYRWRRGPRSWRTFSPASAGAAWSRLALTRAQKRALRDPEGQIALDVLRHLLGARPINPERFPLAEGAFQSIARRLGYVVGQKRCRRMVRRLRETGVVGLCGQYRQSYRNSAVRSGFCVRLYMLGRRLRTSGLGKRKRPDRGGFARHHATIACRRPAISLRSCRAPGGRAGARRSPIPRTG